MRTVFALALLLLAAAQVRAADEPPALGEMSEEQLNAEQERVEDRLLLLQQRRFEARQRHDRAATRHASRKFRSTEAQRQTVLKEVGRRAEEGAGGQAGGEPAARSK